MEKIAIVSHVLPVPGTSGGEKSIQSKILFLSKYFECFFLYSGEDNTSLIKYKKDIINLGCKKVVNISKKNTTVLNTLLNIFFFKPIVYSRLTIDHYTLVSYLEKYSINLINIEHLYSSFGIDFKDLKNKNIKTYLVEHNIEQNLRKNLLRSKDSKSFILYYLISLYEYYSFIFYQKKIYKQIEKIGFLSKEDLLYSINANLYGKETQTHMFYTPPIELLKHSIKNIIEKYANNNYSTLIYSFNQNYRPNIISLKKFLENEFNELLNINNNLILYITGKTNNCNDDLLYLFKKFNKNIKLTGFLPEDEYISLLKESSLLINPILIGSGIKIKNLEAISLGTVVITTAIGAEGIESPYILIDNNIISAYTQACNHTIKEFDYLKNKNFFDNLIFQNKNFYEINL